MANIKIRNLNPGSYEQITSGSFLATALNENEGTNEKLTVRATAEQIVSGGAVYADFSEHLLVSGVPVSTGSTTVGGKTIINEGAGGSIDFGDTNSNLNIESPSIFKESVTIDKTLNVTEAATFNGDSTFKSDVSIDGELDIGGSKALALDYSAANNNKVLKVVGGALSWETDNAGLSSVDWSQITDAPAVSSNDNGKVLKIVGGALTWATDDSGLSSVDWSNVDNKPATFYTHPNHNGDVTSVGDGTTTISNNAVTSAKIADDAVTSAKIADDSISTDKLKTSGEGAISIQQIVPKTITIHIGNYHYQGTKYWASDLYNYNAGTDTYEARTSVTRDFSGNGSLGWGATHYDLKETVVIEPFATYIAGMRYTLQNYGVGCSVLVIIHGHVSAYGTYDLQSGNPFFKDVNNFDNFAKISLQGGAPPDYSGNDADRQVFQTNGVTPGRIDYDNSPRHLIGGQGSNLAYWYRNPIMNIVGTNQVFTSTQSQTVSVRYGVAANQQFAQNRMASVGNITYFYPYVFLENALAYFSSGTGNPNEFYFENSGKMFQAQQGSQVIYSNNGQNHIFVDGGNTSTSLIEFVTIMSGSSFLFKLSSNVYYNSSKTFKAFGANQYPVYLSGAFNQFRTSSSDNFFVGENGIGHSGATLAEHYNYVNNEDTGAIVTNPINRETYTGPPTNGLHNRYSGATGLHSSSTSLNATRLCGHTNTKSAPTTRTGTGGTSNASAPYSDQ